MGLHYWCGTPSNWFDKGKARAGVQVRRSSREKRHRTTPLMGAVTLPFADRIDLTLCRGLFRIPVTLALRQ